MIVFRVEVTDTAIAAITEQARYIAIEQEQPNNAVAWLEKVWEAVDSLESMPRRCAMAEEDAYVDHEVRQLRVGSHLLLFTVDDGQRVVWVLWIRHGRRLPRVGDVPVTKPTLPDGDADDP